MTNKRMIKDLFTGIDGETQDPARWLWILGAVTFLLFAGYSVYNTGKFDMMAFGMAYGALLAGGGAGVKIKESTEPGAYVYHPPRDDISVSGQSTYRNYQRPQNYQPPKKAEVVDDDSDPSLKPPK